MLAIASTKLCELVFKMSGDILKKAYLKGWVPLGEVKKINGASCKRFCGTNSTPGASQDIVMSLIFSLQIRQTSLKPLKWWI